MISSQLNLYSRHSRILHDIGNGNSNNILILQKCSSETSKSLETSNTNEDIRCSTNKNTKHNYPDVLRNGIFCLIVRSVRLVQLNLLESLAANCIPVIMADNIVMPFSEVKYIHLFNFN